MGSSPTVPTSIIYSEFGDFMPDVPVWKEGSKNEPPFPSSYEVTKKAVLQVTDIKTNRNKYYALELHSAKNKYRVYTHYGRTDDLDSNPDAGIRECRYCSSLSEAESLYTKIYKSKTSSTKGYKEINLASSKIGSKKSIGSSSGLVDDKTLKKLSTDDKKIKVEIISKPSITTEVQKLVSHLYDEATDALTSSVNATITANGIETPLGVLTLGQIDKGQDILDKIVSALSKKKKDKDEIVDLSGQFYTVIPHKFGRSKVEALSAVISTPQQVSAKEDTLQLMRDMLNVNGKTNVLVSKDIEKKYQALNCEINILDKSSDDFKKIKAYAQKKCSYAKVKNIYTIKRHQEHKEFANHIGNNKLLFHGSSARNWVGILSRGLLLPKKVVALGGYRTDEGWLGHGIYFGDIIQTALQYADSGELGSQFISLATVALGKIKQFEDITYGLTKPPKGYDSCHGISGTEFDDDEFVIYDNKQQKLEYLLEL